MNIKNIFNIWDNLFVVIGIIISSVVAFRIYKLLKKPSPKDKYKHEIKITNDIQNINIYSSVILADVSKYHPDRADNTNKTYYKQGCELYRIVPEYGVQFMLMPSDENIPVGLVPFDWIEYVRDHDSEDNKDIIVCKFKGIRWYNKFKSPFKEINYVYMNPNYKKSGDPEFLKYTTFKPNILNSSK